MTLVDTNVLVYATFADMREHERARAWLEERLGEDVGAIVFCWPVVQAFLRLITSPRVFGSHAVSLGRGWRVAGGYLDQPGARVVTHGPRHREIVDELVATPGLRSDDVPDVEIAALAIEHGLALATHDAGFRRFPALRLVDPVAS